MNRFLVTLLASSSVLAAACGEAKTPPAAAVPTAAPVEAQPAAPQPVAEAAATVPAPAAGSSLVADFGVMEKKNLLGGDFGSWASAAPDPVGVCRESLVAGEGPDASQAWRIDYDISQEGSYSGIWMRLKDLDATSRTALSFDVRGAGAFSPMMIVELKANGGQRISRHILSGVTGSWKRVSIPLSSFAGLGELKPLYELTLVFDATVCGTNLKGSYLMDNIAFE